MFSCLLHAKYVYMPAPVMNSSVENRPCTESTHCCGRCVMPLSCCQSVFRMGHGWVFSTLDTAVVANRCFWDSRDPHYLPGIHFMKQFAHNWYLYWGQCTGACSHVIPIQDNTYNGAMTDDFHWKLFATRLRNINAFVTVFAQQCYNTWHLRIAVTWLPF